MLYQFKGSIKVIQKNDRDLRPYLERSILSRLASEFAHRSQDGNLAIELWDFEIDLGYKKFKFTTSNQTEEYQTYHVVEHLLWRIFLKKHPRQFGFIDEGEKQKVMRGLDICMIISSGNNKPFFETTRKLFKLAKENKSVFSEEELAEIEACKKLMAGIQEREGQPFKPYILKEEEKNE